MGSVYNTLVVGLVLAVASGEVTQTIASSAQAQVVFAPEHLKKIQPFIKQWQNPRKQIEARLRIAEFYVNHINCYEAAVEIYREVERIVEADPKLPGRQIVLRETQEGLDKAMSFWLSSLDQPPVLEVELKPKSRYFSDPDLLQREPVSGQISVNAQVQVVGEVQGISFRVALPRGSTHGTVWFSLAAANRLILRVPDARSFSLGERIHSYQYFLSRQIPEKYAEAALARLDELKFINARQVNTKSSYMDYVSWTKNKERKDVVAGLLEELVFDEIRVTDSKAGYDHYLSLYPEGQYVDQVNSILKELHALEVARKEKTRVAYSLFLEKYANSWYTDRAKSELDDIDFARAQEADSIEGYQAYLAQHPAGRYKRAVTEAIAYRTQDRLKVLSIVWSYSDSGVTFSGVASNENPFPVNAAVVLSFKTQTETIKHNSNISRFQAEVYEGRYDSSSVSVWIEAGGVIKFSKFFDTMAKGEYRGLILDLFNTEADLRRRLQIAGAPSVKIVVMEGQDQATLEGEGNVEQAKAYLLLAANAKSSEGVKNMLDALGSLVRDGGNEGSEAYKLKAQVGYAEDAVRVAPRYAPARLALARYLYGYAASAIRPGTIFRSYLQAYEEASLSQVLDPGNAEAKRLIEAAKKGVEANALQAGVSASVASKVQEKVLQFKRYEQEKETIDQDVTNGTYIVEGDVLCSSGEVYEKKFLEFYLQRNGEWVSSGNAETDENGSFRLDTEIASNGATVSVKILGECGEGRLRISRPLSNVQILLRE